MKEGFYLMRQEGVPIAHLEVGWQHVRSDFGHYQVKINRIYWINGEKPYRIKDCKFERLPHNAPKVFLVKEGDK